MKFTANCLYCDTPNANGIIFPKEVVAAAVAEYQKTVESGRAIGELIEYDYPYEYSRILSVSLADMSHKFTKVEMVDDHVECSGVVLNTPNGKIIQTLVNSIDSNSFSISPVLMGSITSEKKSRKYRQKTKQQKKIYRQLRRVDENFKVVSDTAEIMRFDISPTSKFAHNLNVITFTE